MAHRRGGRGWVSHRVRRGAAAGRLARHAPRKVLNATEQRRASTAGMLCSHSVRDALTSWIAQSLNVYGSNLIAAGTGDDVLISRPPLQTNVGKLAQCAVAATEGLARNPQAGAMEPLLGAPDERNELHGGGGDGLIRGGALSGELAGEGVAFPAIYPPPPITDDLRGRDTIEGLDGDDHLAGHVPRCPSRHVPGAVP